MNLIEIGQIIQSRRSSLQLKQQDLAELAGITEKTIYLVENGKGNPSLATLLKIVATLGMEINIQVKKHIA